MPPLPPRGFSRHGPRNEGEVPLPKRIPDKWEKWLYEEGGHKCLGVARTNEITTCLTNGEWPPPFKAREPFLEYLETEKERCLSAEREARRRRKSKEG